MSKAFTGKAPFYGVAPTAVAVGVLAGRRPPRPAHRCLTNNLWELVERCWNQDPRDRPDISDVILDLRTPTLQHNRTPVPDDTTLPSSRQRKLPIGELLLVVLESHVSARSEGFRFRPSRWTPISYVLQRLRKFYPSCGRKYGDKNFKF